MTLNLAPITILAGPNNAGKSSIISALRVLSQSLASLDPDTSLLLEGLGSYKHAVYQNDSKRHIGFNLEFEHDSRKTAIDLTYGYRVQRREVILQQFIASEFRDIGPEVLMRTIFAMATVAFNCSAQFEGFRKQASAKIPIKLHPFSAKSLVLSGWSE